MTTRLDRVLKRELLIGGEPYTLTLSEQGFTLTIKGRRIGLDIRWADLVGGDAALATALNASLTANIVPRGKAAAKSGTGTTEPRTSKAESRKVAGKPVKVPAKRGKVPAKPANVPARPTKVPAKPKRRSRMAGRR